MEIHSRQVGVKREPSGFSRACSCDLSSLLRLTSYCGEREELYYGELV